MVVSLLCYGQVGSAQRSYYGRLFLDTMNEIRRQYVEEVDELELTENALAGMVGRLDDYSSYMPPRAFREFQESTERRFGGIGIQVVLDNETRQLTVLSPLVGTPAYEAGIVAGDRIVSINGESTDDITLEEAVERMRGNPGEPLTLEILHPNAEEPVEVELVRDVIQVDTILGDWRNSDGTWNFFLEGNDSIGYVRLVAFSESTASELKAALDWLLERGMQGLILDLRNNPGGLLNVAAQVSDMFIDEGTIVSTRGRDGRMLEVYEATPEGTYRDFPMVVLVNRYSASASEIVAACLQDHNRAVVIGERTWGKGNVQNVVALPHGAVKLTIASYWRPNGHNIHRGRNATEEDEWGVMPNDGYTVEVDDELFRKLMRLRRQRDIVKSNGAAAPPVLSAEGGETEEEAIDEEVVDPQVQKGVEYLESVIPSKAKTA